jgi:hypothetical protein
VFDCLREDNAEIETDAQAAEELANNVEIRAAVVELMRSLNIRTDANLDEPGQTPKANGEMGPAVRDGHMTRDQAAEMASAEMPGAPSK